MTTKIPYFTNNDNSLIAIKYWQKKIIDYFKSIYFSKARVIKDDFFSFYLVFEECICLNFRLIIQKIDFTVVIKN